MRKIVGTLLAALLIILIGAPVPAAAAPRSAPRPGAPGIGDPYFPTDGNGGYDVAHYDLKLSYDPATDRLRGRATISARATQALSSFNLDLNGLEVTGVRVNGRPARWRHVGDELTITPQRAIGKRSRFQVVVRYGGVPLVLDEPALGQAGVFPTDDGALIVGQPHVADTWFPVNDHPLDKASYRFEVTVPRGPRGGRQRPPGRRRAEPAHSHLDLDRPGPDGLLPRHRHDRAVQPRLPTRRRHPLLGCHRPGPLRPGRSAYRGSLRHHGRGRLRVQATEPGDRRPRRRRGAVVLRQPEHRAGMGLLLRRSPPGRHRRLDHPAGSQRAHQPGHRGQLPGLARPCIRSSPTTRPPHGDELVHPERHHRGLARGEWIQRRLRAVAAGPVGLRRRVGRGRPGAGQRRVGRRSAGSSSTT